MTPKTKTGKVGKFQCDECKFTCLSAPTILSHKKNKHSPELLNKVLPVKRKASKEIKRKASKEIKRYSSDSVQPMEVDTNKTEIEITNRSQTSQNIEEPKELRNETNLLNQKIEDEHEN